jgi:hypothetical protein
VVHVKHILVIVVQKTVRIVKDAIQHYAKIALLLVKCATKPYVKNVVNLVIHAGIIFVKNMKAHVMDVSQVCANLVNNLVNNVDQQFVRNVTMMKSGVAKKKRKRKKNQ